MDTTQQAPPRYWVRITNTEHAGRFVAFHISGVITDHVAHIDSPRPLVGTRYSSWGQFSPNSYFEAGARAVQAELKKANYTSELIFVPAEPKKPSPTPPTS